LGSGSGVVAAVVIFLLAVEIYSSVQKPKTERKKRWKEAPPDKQVGSIVV
jgi:hypothetical protein